MACSRIDKEIGAPSFAFLNLHAQNQPLNSQHYNRSCIRGGDADSEKRRVPILGAVGVVVHQTDGLSVQAVRVALGEDGGKCPDGLRAEELACLYGSLLDGWNAGRGDIVQGDFQGDSEGSEGGENKEGDGEAHCESYYWRRRRRRRRMCILLEVTMAGVIRSGEKHSNLI